MDTFEYIPLLPRLSSAGITRNLSYVFFEYRRRVIEVHKHQGPNRKDFGDVFDGSLCQEIISSPGGEEKAAYDIFLDVSMDGFDVFGNAAYDCWPIIGGVHNLDPNHRFLMRNVIPLGFINPFAWIHFCYLLLMRSIISIATVVVNS